MSHKEIEIFLSKKLSALNEVAKRIGVFNPTQEELQERLDKYGIETAAACIAVLLSDAHPVSKAAAGKLLECFFPDWRAYADTSLIGHVVKRDDKEVRLWKATVLERDGHKCQSCGAGDNLHVHHIASWAEFPELRVVTSNGLTLCQPCHVAEHGK